MATEPYSFIEARNEAARRAAPFLYGLPSQGIPAVQQAPVAVPQVSPYGIPAMRPMPPQAAPMLPQAAPAPVAPIASPTPAAPPVAPRAAPTAAQKFRRMVQEAERAAGAPLDDIAFDTIKQRYWANEVIPSLIANKETEGRVKLRKEQFDTKAQQFFEDYTKRNAAIPGSAEAAAADPSILGDTLRDLGVGFAGGLGQLSAGIGSLADYGVRIARTAREAMVRPFTNPAESIRFARDVAGDIARGDISAASDKLMANYGLAPPTALGEISADFSKGVSEGTQSLLSTRGRQASERLGPAFEEAESVGDVLGAIGENAAAIPGVVGQGAASLVGGLPLRAAGAVRALAAIPAYQRAFTAAAAVGLPQSAGSTAQFETELRDMTLSELLKDNPEGKQVYDILADTMAGAPQADIDKAVKEVLVNRATAVAGMANVAGDVLLAAAIPGGAENVAAGLGRGVGRGRRLLRTTAAETAEEAGAGGIQQAGQNVSTNLATGANIPVGQGVLGQAALGGVAGGIVGGGAGLVGPGGEGAQSLRSLRRSRRQPAPAAPEATPAAPQEQPAPEAAATPAPTPSAAPEAVQPAPVEPVESPIAAPGPGVEEDALTTLVSSATKAAKTFAATTTGKRLIGQLKEPAAVVTSAARLAEKTAGAEWANLNAVQRQDLIEATTVELNKRAKVDKDGIAATLSEMRRAVTAPVESGIVETPLPEGLAEGLAAADAAAETAEQEAEAAEEPPPPEVVELVTAPVVPEVNGVPTSWVIRDKTTGQVRLETSDPKAVAALNTKKYEAVPVLQHLQEINTEGTLAYQAARQETSAPTPAPRKRLRKTTAPAAAPTPAAPPVAPVVEATPAPTRRKRLRKTATPAADTTRTADLATIHALQRTAGLDRAAYEDVLEAATGKQSSIDMTPEERAKAIVALGALAREATPPETPSPNVEAPAPSAVTGAEQETEASPLESPSQSPVSESETEAAALAAQATEEAQEIESPEAVVERIVGDNVTEDDARDLAAAIQEARDGSPSELNTLLRTMQADGAISRTNARAVRQASRVTQLPANERASGREAIDESTAEERQVEAALLYQEANEIEGTSNDKLVHLLERTAQATTLDPAERALASRMAKLAKQLKTKLVIREDPEATVAGEYDRNTNTVHLYAASHMSTLHEMLHGITSNLLASDNPALNIPGVRKLRKDFDALLKRLRDHVEETGTDHSDPFVAHMLKSKNGPTSNTRELLAYGMSSRKFQEYLRGIKAPAGNLWQRFKDAIATFFGRTPKQRTLLDAIMDSGAEAIALVEDNTQLISNVNASESVLDPRDPMMAVTPSKTNPAKDYGGVSEFQRGFELFSNSVIGLEFTDHALRRAGIELTPEQSMYIAGRNYSGHVVDMRQSDERTYIKPVSDLLARMLASGEFSAVSTAEFQTDLDEFFQAYHMLTERGPSLWAETVELKEGRDIDRAQIIEDMTSGTISPQEGYAQIRALAEQYAEEGFKRWGYRTGMMGSTPSELETVLEKAAEKGYTPESLAELNNLLQGIRDRTRQHLTDAGIISEGDPWVDARNWQWYVPIKSEQEPVTSLNYGGATFRNRNVQVMQGGGQGDTLNAINELAISMAASSDAMAESILVQRAWDLVSENTELFGAEITPYEGIPKTGYVFEKDGKEHHTNFLPNPKNGFIQHDGDVHFVVELPEGDSIGGQLARGLKGFRSISNLQSMPGLLGKGAKALGQTTNIAARLYTTWSPTWQAFTSFFRNTMEVPTVIAVELFDNPIGATPFFIKFSKETVSNVLSMRSFVPEMRAVVTGDRSALAQYAEDHPGSYPWWTLQLLEAGGSSEFQAAFNQQRATDALFAKARRAERGVLDLPASAYRWWVDFTSAFATFVEYKTRTAAFKTLVEQQKLSPSHAAALVKGSLDFNQSGEWGQNINMVHAFYRVGATDIDNFRRVFTKQTGPDAGSFDFPKLSKWAPFFAMLGAAAYMTVAAMLGDDDDGVEKIKKIDPYTLTQRMILPWGDGYIGYPIGLGLPQLLLATGTLGAAVASGHITAEQAGEAYLRVVERNLPVQSLGKRKGSGLAGALGAWFAGITTPTLVAPVSELWRNTNSFGFPIRTDFPNDKKYKSDQARNSTPEEWTEMAQWLRETTGWDVFPEELRHLSRAYGGQPASGIARWALDEKAKEDAGLEPTGVKQMLRLQVNDAQFYYSRQMYAALEELEDAQKIQNANPEKANDPRLKRRVQAYKELKSARKKYYDDINKIRENKLMSATGKRDQRKLADGRLREAVNKAERVIEATAE